jgi:hypothetical protein
MLAADDAGYGGEARRRLDLMPDLVGQGLVSPLALV